MALTGLEIYKLLPKTNCKECGMPTCLAFAMRLAQQQIELATCPYVSEEAKSALAAAAQPPIRLVALGNDDTGFKVGNETVLFRHEKTFFNQTGLMLRVKDTDSSDAVGQLVSEVSKYSVERVGHELSFNGFAIQNESGEQGAFVESVKAARANTNLPLILISQDPAIMDAALEVEGENRPLIYAATEDNLGAMAELAKKHSCPLAVYKPDNLSELADLTEQAVEAGVEDLVIDPGARGFGNSLPTLTQLRRLALKKNFRPLGYPIITFPGEATSSPQEEALLGGQQVAKYAGIVVLDHFEPALAYPLLTMRMNIYTDPQKPIQVQPGLYEIGTPKADSPLLVTTNYSLTYFSVAGEVESAGLPSWLLISDTEGLSVLTSWAAGKFDAEVIAKTVKAADLSSIEHRKIVIPGAVAVLLGELEEELPDWNIMVGPREAVDLGSYLKRSWSA
jgi:acetyl-CoA decarbonylase/synthase complex subunit gamma